MTDFAGLGLRFETQGAERAEKALDGIAQKAGRAERATDALAGGSGRLNSATMQLLRSIEQSVKQLVEIQRAQHEFTRGMAEGAAAAIREAMAVKSATAAVSGHATAVEQAASANIRFSHSFQMVQAGATGAAAPLDRLGDRARKAAVDFGDFYDVAQRDFHSAWVSGTTRADAAAAGLDRTLVRSRGNARLASHEMLNLSRQIADVGMMAALGQAPMLILLQQGPQIADVFQTAGMRGIGFGAAMRQIVAAAAPLLAAIAPIVGVVAGAAAGFALFHRELSKGFPKDITDGMNLTEEQLERVKHKTVTMGDTFQATLNVIGRHIMDGPVGDALNWMSEEWGRTLDTISSIAFEGATRLVAFYTAAYKTIVDNWKNNFPGAMEAIFVAVANSNISAMEWMVNGNIKLINKLISAWNNLGPMKIPLVPEVPFDSLKLKPITQGGREAMADFEAHYKEDLAAVQGAARSLGAEIAAEALKVARDKARKEAGKPNPGRATREPKGPSAEDMAEQFAQRRADIERQIEQAKMEELQAQLALTHGISERAAIEREIARQQSAVKAAQLKAQLERINADDKLTDAAKQELAAMLLGVAIRQGNVARLQQQAIDEAEAEALRKQASDIAQRSLDADIHVLQSQLDLERGYFARRDIQRQILTKEIEKRKLAIEELKASKDAKDHAEAVARERELQADLIAEARRREREVLDGYRALRGELDGVVDAFRRHDWATLVEALATAITDLKAAWSARTADGKIDWGSRGSAISSVASMAGQAIGGKTGAAISGAASGAMSAFALGSALKIGALAGPWGMAAGAVIGGLMSLFGSGKADKERKRQEEAQRQAERARRAEEVARQARELELSLAEATGDVLGALNAQRAAFMEGIAEENRAMAERVYALQQAKQAQEAYNQLFLTEQERLVQTAAELGDGFKSLNLAVPQSMAEFKALADGIDRTTAAGQQLFAGLMALGPAFAQVAGFIGSLQGAAAALTPYQAAQGRVAAAQQAVAAAEANLQKAIAAETAANNAAAQAAQRVAQQFRSLADSLAKYRQTLTTGDAARLSPEEAYKQAKAAFDAIQGKTDAESLGKLQEVSEDYRKASEAYYGTSLGYFQDLERIKAAVQLGEKHADKTATAAEQQVAALEAANEALNGIGEGVMGVAEAQKMLALAQEELRLAEEELKREELNLLQQIRDALTNGGGTPGAANDNVWTATGYLAKNADVKAHWDQGIPQKHGFTNEHEWAWSHWTGIGQSEGRKFATGGMFAGGLVNGPTAFPMGLMGEAGPEAIMPLANVGGQLGVRAAGNDNGDVVEAIKGLGERLERIERSLGEDKAQRAAIYQGTAGQLAEVKDELSAVKRKVAR